MAGRDVHEDPTRTNRRLIAIAIAVAIGGMLVLSLTRGVWLDELYTLFFTRHDLPLAELYRQRWRIDPHPPLFYTWIWAMIGLFGDDFHMLRLWNAAGLFAFLASVLVVRRRSALDPTYLLLFALLLLSSPFTIVNFAELRSYFFQICLFASLLLFVQALGTRESDLDPRRDRSLATGVALTLLTAANLHYFCALCCFILVGVALLHDLYRRRWRMAALYLACGAIAAVPLALAFVSYVTHVARATSAVPQSVLGGYRSAIAVLAIGLGANIVAFAYAGLAVIRARRGRGMALPAATIGPFALALATLGAILLVMTTVNWKLHFLIPRYLLPVIPLAASAIALLAAGQAGRRWFALVPLNALAVTIAATAHQASNRRWEYNLPTIEAAVRACPTTRILAYNMQYLYDRDRQGNAMLDRRIDATIEYGYPYIAARNGLRIESAPAPGAVIRPTGPCPIIVWLEGNYQRRMLTAAELLDLAHIVPDPGRPSRIQYRRDGDHALLIVHPH